MGQFSVTWNEPLEHTYYCCPSRCRQCETNAELEKRKKQLAQGKFPFSAHRYVKPFADFEDGSFSPKLAAIRLVKLYGTPENARRIFEEQKHWLEEAGPEYFPDSNWQRRADRLSYYLKCVCDLEREWSPETIFSFYTSRSRSVGKGPQAWLKAVGLVEDEQS